MIQVENLRMTPVTLKMTKKTKHLADLVMEDENNNEVNNGDISEDLDQITLYVRAGCDNRKYGACPFCQRIFMFLMLKSEQGGKNPYFYTVVEIQFFFENHSLGSITYYVLQCAK